MSEASVGKISLDIDLKSGLSKQIKDVGNHIGRQLSSTVQSHMNGVKNSMSFKMPKKSFQMPKRTFSTKSIEQNNEQLEASLDNLNQKIDVQKQKLAALKAEFSGGLSDKVKNQIEQQNQIMQASEIRIEAQRNKLRQLKESYENAVSDNRRNKLAEEISKTEYSISGLVLKSDKALHKINELEAGMNSTSQNTLREKIVNTEASLMSLGQRAEKLRNQMNQSGDGMDNAGRKAERAERPVRRLGNAFSSSGGKASNMAVSFQRAMSRMLKQVFIFAIIYKALHGLSSFMGSALRTNDQFMHSLAQVRSNLMVAFMPIYQAILPALQSLVNWLAKATTYIASFISVIFGKTFKQSFRAAQGLNAARVAMDGYGASSKKAAKAAKEAKEAMGDVAGFDEVNTLADTSAGAGVGDPGGAGGGGAGGAGGGIAPLVTPDIDTSAFEKKLKSFFGKVKKFFEPVTKIFKDFYKSINWGAIKKGLNNVWEALKPLGKNLGKGLLWFLENVLVPIGTFVWNEVVPRLLDMLADTIGILGNVIMWLKPVAKWLFDNFLAPLGKWTGKVILKALDAVGAALKNIRKWTADPKKAWEDFKKFSGIIWSAIKKTITKMASDAWKSVTGVFSGVGKWFQKNVGDVIPQAISAVKSLAKTKASEIWTSITFVFKNAYEWFKKNLADKIPYAIGKVVSGVKTKAGEIWSGIKEKLTGKYEWFKTSLADKIPNAIAKVVSTVKSKTGEVWTGIKDKLTGKYEWFKNNLANKIPSAIGSAVKDTKAKAGEIWTGIKEKFSDVQRWFQKNVADKISSAFGNIKYNVTEGLYKSVKGLINQLIDLINKPLKEIKAWSFMGAKPFEFLPTIPKLARGGIIDQPTLAMVGEAGKEAVMPLENNTGWISNLAGQIAGQMGGSGGDNQGIIEVLLMILAAIERLNNNMDGEPVFQFDGKVFARLLNPYLTKENARKGKTMLKPL